MELVVIRSDSNLTTSPNKACWSLVLYLIKRVVTIYLSLLMMALTCDRWLVVIDKLSRLIGTLDMA